MRKSKWVTAALYSLLPMLILISPDASAQNFGELIRSVTEGNIGPIYLAAMFLFYAVGGIVIGIALIIVLMRNERNADKYSWGMIVKMFVAGGALLAIGFLIDVARDTSSDGQSTDQLPSFGHYQSVDDSQLA